MEQPGHGQQLPYGMSVLEGEDYPVNNNACLENVNYLEVTVAILKNHSHLICVFYVNRFSIFLKTTKPLHIF